MLLLLCGMATHAQNFSVNAVATPTTCNTAGSLTFSVDDEHDGIPVTYNVYLMPDIANAVAQTNQNTVTGLAAGNYYITATQNTEGGLLTAITQVTITDNSGLAFTILNTTPLCDDGQGGSFTVNITSGTAATYQIDDYPTPMPPQSSPVFSNLIPGYYSVTVTDVCGNQATEFATIASGDTFYVSLAVPSGPQTTCDSLNVMLFLESIASENQAPIAYPLTVEFTVHLADGTDVVIEQELATGNAWYQEIEQLLPGAIPGEYLDFDVNVYYPCGVTYNVTPFIPPGQSPVKVEALTVIGQYLPAECGQQYLQVNINYGIPPYTIAFASAPGGFSPSDYNAQYPGPYSAGSVAFGSFEQPAPIGAYEAVITDSCGDTKSAIFILTPTWQIDGSGYNYDCINNLGGIDAASTGTVPGVFLAGAIITQAPEAYNFALPHDVSSAINEAHELHLENLPPGDYYFTFSDNCGNTLTKIMHVLNFVPGIMIGDQLPDCEPGLGTVSITSPNPPFTAMTILIAPAAFPYPLPFDASANINSNGSFYMDGLPEGDYRFLGEDQCYNPEKPRFYIPYIEGYEVNTNTLDIVPGCDAYDITLTYSSNVASETYWLQKQQPDGTWVHPITGQPYTEGAQPDDTTAMSLISAETFTANGWEGTYRILRYYSAYTAGTIYKDCIAEIKNFELFQGLQLLETNILSCPGNPIDLELITNGAAPVTYTIIRRNNIPYLIQNGENNIFTGLEAATYTVEITDSCGRTLTTDIVTQDATPLIVVHHPGTLYTCDEGNDGTDTFTLSSQTQAILGSQNPDEYTVTYHNTQANADIGIESLPNEYTSEPRTIYARVIKNDTPGCYATISFALQLYRVPEFKMESPVAFCPGESVTLTAPAGYVGYRWSNGSLNQQITVSTQGTYTITVTNAQGCETAQNVSVIESPIPHISNVEVADFTENNNSITIQIDPTAVPIYPEYSLDGVNWQHNNVFDNLEAGIYTVYVRDEFGCGSDYRAVYLLTYPRYFTPNGDSYNETWRIPYSAITEPDMQVYIYDRFGRLITGFDATSKGWDGTLNGKPMPATDYWFVVKRQDGKEYRGHFSLIR